MMALISVRGLKKTYKSNKTRVEALKGIDFDIKKGEITGLLGPNGAGKTTTIKCILGLILPTEGKILVDGVNVVRHNGWAYKKMSAVLEGNRNIFWRMTVFENLKFFAGLQGIPIKRARKDIDELIEFFGLGDKRKVQARLLSRGMQQRLAVASAFVRGTDVLLLDEPTLGLDVEASYELRGLIKRKAQEEGKTILLSSHDMKVVEDLCHRVIIINQGKIVVDDTVRNLKSLFTVSAFKFEIEEDLPESSLEEIKANFFRAHYQKDSGNNIITVEFRDFAKFYELIDMLRKMGVKIKNITSTEPDFENVYLRIVRGENVDAG